MSPQERIVLAGYVAGAQTTRDVAADTGLSVRACAMCAVRLVQKGYLERMAFVARLEARGNVSYFHRPTPGVAVLMLKRRAAA